MSDIPAGWSVARLGDLCIERVGNGEPGSVPTPYIDIGSIDRDSKTIGELELVTKSNAPSRARQSVKTGDVLVSMTRPNLNAVAIVGPTLDGAIASTGFDVLRSNGDVLPEWIFNRVRSHEFVEDVCKGLQGVVYPAIRPRDVRQHQLPVPPIEEQHRIVAAIEDHFSRLDEAVALLERVQRNLKRYRASVLKAAVEGRLVPTEAELARAEGRTYEPASVLLERILDERRRRWKSSGANGPYKEPAAPDTANLPPLPEGWCWAPAEAVSDVVDPHPSHRTPPIVEGGIPYVGMGDVRRDGSINLGAARRVAPQVLEEHRARYSLGSGDFIFGKIGTLAEPVHLHQPFDYALSANVVLVQPVGGLDGTYLLHWMCSPALTNMVTREANSTSQPAFGIKRVRSLPVPVPPLEEQHRITAEVDKHFCVINLNHRALSETVIRLQRLRQSILKWAFEGRLVEQDHHDEPASVLLDRIRLIGAKASVDLKPCARRSKRSGVA